MAILDSDKRPFPSLFGKPTLIKIIAGYRIVNSVKSGRALTNMFSDYVNGHGLTKTDRKKYLDAADGKGKKDE